MANELHANQVVRKHAIDGRISVAAYCLAFKESGMSPDEWARFFRAYFPFNVLPIMEKIGSWPSSEPELAALQRIA